MMTEDDINKKIARLSKVSASVARRCRGGA
jgi:hypothetical protein